MASNTVHTGSNIGVDPTAGFVTRGAQGNNMTKLSEIPVVNPKEGENNLSKSTAMPNFPVPTQEPG